MPLSEFEIIARYFAGSALARPEVVLGVGDDAAVLALPADRQVLADAGSYLLGRDFTAGDAPASVAQRALAAALARLSARGAEPFAFTLALTLPEVDEQWLEQFSAGLAELARRHSLALIGGDTTRGALSFTLHLQGLLAPEHLVPNRGASAGELLYTTGPLGGSALALLDRFGELRLSKPEREIAYRHLEFPEPPRALGAALSGVATGAGTLSGGLSSAIAGLLATQRTGATVQLQQVPIDPILRARLHRPGGWNLLRDEQAPAQVCFSVPATRQAELEQRLREAGVQAAWIGTVDAVSGVRCLLPDGSAL